LLEVPAGCLFRAVMPTADRCQIAPAGAPALVKGHGVIEVASNGRPPAAGEAARPLPDLDQMPQCQWHLVARRLKIVAAVVLLEQTELVPKPGNPPDHRLVD